MLDLSKTRAIVTGASRGIGAVIADALAARGVELLLVARSKDGLEAVRSRVARHGRKVLTLAVDLADRAALEHVVQHAERELGPIDLLVNNAGVEQTCYYEDLSAAEIEQFIAVNLTGPMVLSRLLLPGMLERNRGHIVNIASLAGLGPAAFGEPYGATKHGLVGFTRSLRASLQTRGSAVSASVICPGFVSDAGMYHNMNQYYGVVAPPQLGTCTPEAVAEAALRAIERDEPEVIVNGKPIRHLIAFGTAVPRVYERIAKALDAYTLFYQVAQRRRVERDAQAESQALTEEYRSQRGL